MLLPAQKKYSPPHIRNDQSLNGESKCQYLNAESKIYFSKPRHRNIGQYHKPLHVFADFSIKFFLPGGIPGFIIRGIPQTI